MNFADHARYAASSERGPEYGLPEKGDRVIVRFDSVWHNVHEFDGVVTDVEQIGQTNPTFSVDGKDPYDNGKPRLYEVGLLSVTQTTRFGEVRRVSASNDSLPVWAPAEDVRGGVT